MPPADPSTSRRGVLAAAASVLGAGCASPLSLDESDASDVSTASPWGDLGGSAYRPEARPPRREVERAWDHRIFGFFRRPATPVSIDGLVYSVQVRFPWEFFLQGISIETGRVEKSFGHGKFYSPPAFVARSPYENGSLIVTHPKGVRAIDPEGGPPVFGEDLMTRWQYPVHTVGERQPERINHAPVPLVDGDRAVVTMTGANPGVVQVNPANGRVRWHFNDSEDEEYHRPAIGDGRVFVVDFHDGIWALDAETGETDWTTRLERRGVRPPIAADGTVYVGSWSGVRAFDAATGRRRWRRSSPTPVAGIALADGVLYYGSRGDEGRLVALDVASRSVRWEAPGPVTGQPVVAGETLLVPRRDELVAFDAGTGRRLWSRSVGRPIAPPLVVRGRVVVAAGNRLYALGGRR